MVDAFVFMMITPKGFSGILNAGNPNKVTISDLANIIINLTTFKSKLIFKELSELDRIASNRSFFF